MFSLTPSRLYDQTSFYNAFLQDLGRAKTLVIIESPFITKKRIDLILPAYSFYVRIAAVHLQEPMFGVTLLMQEKEDQEVAKRVISLSQHGLHNTTTFRAKAD